MSDSGVPETVEAQNQFVRDAWDANAEYWDERMGEGNEFRRLLLSPSIEQLLGPVEGRRVLEVACGNGQLARRLADLGANVTATDFALNMLARAKQKSAAYAGRVEYLPADATSESELLALSSEPFDAIVCNMGIMDMAEIEPLARAARSLLKPDAPFVFTVLHPCFNTEHTTQVREGCNGPDGRWRVEYLVRVAGYKRPLVSRGEAIFGQPSLQLYFHRPLEMLLEVFFREGYVVDGWIEPTLPEVEERGREPNWRYLNDIPPVLICRLRTRGRG